MSAKITLTGLESVLTKESFSLPSQEQGPQSARQAALLRGS